MRLFDLPYESLLILCGYLHNKQLFQLRLVSKAFEAGGRSMRLFGLLDGGDAAKKWVRCGFADK